VLRYFCRRAFRESARDGPSRDTESMSGPAPPGALRVRSLRKAYKDVVAVDGLDLEVPSGECFGLLGPNGAGKTTTIEICEGLTAADSGDVEVLGLRWNTDAAELRQRLGIQLQETQLSEKLTVSETLRLFRSFFHKGPDVSEVIALVQLEEKRRSRVGGLSGGQKQRLALACALVGDPDFLFLDEPTTGLDPQSRRQLWEIIGKFQERGGTVLLTTHYMDEAERLCDRLAIIDHGLTIASGTTPDLIERLGGHHMVEFDATGMVPGELAPWRELPGVEAVHEEDGRVVLSVREPHGTIPALLAAIQNRNGRLLHLTTRQASLEDVFVHLTGRHLREE